MSGFGGFAPLPIRLGGSDTEGWAAAQHGRAAADIAALVASSFFAIVTFTKSGSSYTLHGYSGINGMGEPNAPAMVSGGTGITTITWPSVVEDEYEASDAILMKHIRVTGSGATAIIGVGAQSDLTLNPAQIEVRTYDAAGALVDGKCTVVVGHWTRVSRIGHYDGATDKRDAVQETTPYAALWYDEYTAALGSGFTSARTGLVHCRKVALSRAEAGIQRGAEKINANSHPNTADDMLGEWVKILQLRLRGDETKQEIRQRAGAKFKAAVGNSTTQVDAVVSELLGSLFVQNLRSTGTDLATPPTMTFWPGINPGSPSYSLGLGAWFSQRSHLVVSVVGPSDINDANFSQLVNVELYNELDRLLPAWETFNWAVGVADTGFILDVSQLDFGGLT